MDVLLSCYPRYKLILCSNLVYYGNLQLIPCFSWPTLNFIHIKTLFSCPWSILYDMHMRNSNEWEKWLIVIGLFEQFIESGNKMRVTAFAGKDFSIPSLCQQKAPMFDFWSLELLYLKNKKSWSKIVKSRHGPRSPSWIVHESRTWTVDKVTVVAPGW